MNKQKEIISYEKNSVDDLNSIVTYCNDYYNLENNAGKKTKTSAESEKYVMESIVNCEKNWENNYFAVDSETEKIYKRINGLYSTITSRDYQIDELFKKLEQEDEEIDEERDRAIEQVRSLYEQGYYDEDERDREFQRIDDDYYEKKGYGAERYVNSYINYDPIEVAPLVLDDLVEHIKSCTSFINRNIEAYTRKRLKTFIHPSNVWKNGEAVNRDSYDEKMEKVIAHLIAIKDLMQPSVDEEISKPIDDEERNMWNKLYEQIDCGNDIKYKISRTMAAYYRAKSDLEKAKEDFNAKKEAVKTLKVKNYGRKRYKDEEYFVIEKCSSCKDSEICDKVKNVKFNEFMGNDLDLATYIKENIPNLSDGKNDK